MMGLTPGQAKVLAFIQKRQEERGSTPSYRQIAAGIDRSVCTVHRLIEGLVERGRIRKHPGRMRSLEVVQETPLSAFTTNELLRELARRQVQP